MIKRINEEALAVAAAECLFYVEHTISRKVFWLSRGRGEISRETRKISRKQNRISSKNESYQEFLKYSEAAT
ncbi:hypothetical protein P4V41_02855 [Fictibacillus nanhaiensis]|uniref:hypothetical protein n=1 Tax=Fictibacillus nanhaiensis TaxID=742169 RepID=UPI002E1A4BA6|nr:hypothetical protein [Fictibacillus nanhaiensis]